MSTLLEAGKLISTTDMKLARKLQTTVKVKDITKGRTPQALRQSARALSFMLNGEYYELAAV